MWKGRPQPEVFIDQESHIGHDLWEGEGGCAEFVDNRYKGAVWQIIIGAIAQDLQSVGKVGVVRVKREGVRQEFLDEHTRAELDAMVRFGMASKGCHGGGAGRTAQMRRTDFTVVCVGRG